MNGNGQLKQGARVVGLAALLALSAALAGCAVGMLRGAASSGDPTAPAPAQRSASQISADSAISTAVRSKLAANAVLKPFNLLVDTHDGIVTLRGQVAKVDQRDAAQIEARSVKGVKSVQNLVTVR